LGDFKTLRHPKLQGLGIKGVKYQHELIRGRKIPHDVPPSMPMMTMTSLVG
jgi:hypothetical protein